MKRTIHLLGSVMLCATTLVGSGCAAVVAAGAVAAAGVGTIFYVKGELQTTVEASLDDTYNAAQKAVKDLEFKLESESKDAFEARVEAETAEASDVTIKLKKASDTTTEIGIRVGVFGDQAKSETILAEMKKHL